MRGNMEKKSSWLERYLLPGLAFKAVVIGGGYATGRELATFFMPSGPVGGLYGMVLAMVIWSVVAVVTFTLAFATNSHDYRTFFRRLLGPFWRVFEICYFLAIILILAVFAAAAGAIGHAAFGWPELYGTLILMTGIALVTASGNSAVERLFKYVSFFLYLTYAAFVYLSLSHSGDKTAAALLAHTPTTGWFMGGVTYAGYNIIGAVIILPTIRHLTSRKDAVVAGLLAGPLAMIPAILFFICMIAYYPTINNEPLPSDFMLMKLGLPAFRMVFQAMIFAALLESATGGVHAINERIAHAYRGKSDRVLTKTARLVIALAVMIVAVFVATRFGLIELIAKGYTWIAYVFLAIYILPLMTYGVWLLLRGKPLKQEID
jgi:uncharacterized membrane protein YkvI